MLLDGNRNTYYFCAVLMQVLCNESSIMATYSSNHTLKLLRHEAAEACMPEDLRALLQLNSENNNSQSARLKIIQAHFPNGFNSQPFTDMERNLMPHALSWMSRDGTMIETNDSFYNFHFIKSNIANLL